MFIQPVNSMRRKTKTRANRKINKKSHHFEAFNSVKVWRSVREACGLICIDLRNTLMGDGSVGPLGLASARRYRAEEAVLTAGPAERHSRLPLH